MPRGIMSDNFPLAQTDVSCVALFSKSNIELCRSPAIPSRSTIHTSDDSPASCLVQWHNHSNSSYPWSIVPHASTRLNKRGRVIRNNSLNPHDNSRDLIEISGIRNPFDIYRKILRRVSETNRDVCLQMLRWVSHAARPLSVLELLSAIGYQMNSRFAAADIEKISCGLLNISPGNTVNLIHLSLQDYLESQSIEDDVLGWGGLSGISHEMIATTCLRLLHPTDILESPSDDRLPDRLDTFHDQQRQSIYLYARQYWRFHYIHAAQQSYCLPGMIHEKLRDRWNQRGNIFGTKFLERPTAIEMKSRKSANISAFALLDAALREGARSGMVKLVKLELEMGASPNAPDSLGMTPMDHAAAVGSCAAIKVLQDYGANANTVSNLGENALFHAISNGRIKAVRLLLNLTSLLKSTQPGTHQNRNDCESSDFLYQKLSLVVSVGSYCSHCDNIQNQYVLSKSPCNGKDAEGWPPIFVMDQPASQAKCVHSVMQDDSQLCRGAILSEERTMVTWFPGINMYRALGIAARSGMGVVLKLLLLAANDVRFLQRNVSLSKLMSEMRIS